MAYGPTPTRTLAKWTLDTGHYVIRNADNLVMYCLSTWLTSGIGVYPKLSEVKNVDRLIDAPWLLGGSVYNYNGTINLSPDAAVLAAGLAVEPDEVEPLYYDRPQGYSDTDDSSADICIDDVANPAVDLQGPLLAPKPADFNCNCGESGCSADSMPCCANGSCACHYGESGCAAEDPSCCANGSYAPLPVKMIFRMERMQRK